MRRVLSRSVSRKIAATIVAATGFVLLYEATTNDAVWPWQAAGVDRTGPVPGARLQFSATAYCKGTTTTSGVGVTTGIAAADAGLLPVGSVLAVTTDNPRYNGVYTVMDTGPAVQGREIDLYMWSCNEALAFGRKDVQITVLRLGWNPSASTPSLIDRILRRRLRTQVTAPAETHAPASMSPPPDGSGAEAASEAPATTETATDSGQPAAPSPATPH